MDDGHKETQADGGAPVFKSTDIYATKAHNQGEYFVNKTKEPFSKKVKTWLTKNKKLVILLAIALIILIAGIICLIIFWPKETPTTPTITYADIDQIFEDSTTTNKEKIAAANEKIATVESEGKTSEAFNLKSDLVRHLIEDSEDYDSAIEYIWAIDEDGLDAAQLWECYNLLALAYDGIGDTERANEYRLIAEQYQYQLDASLNAEENFLEEE